MRRPSLSARVVLLVLVLLGGASCRQAAREDLFARAEYLVLEKQLDEATPLLREYLLTHPKDAGAHYYLARCYAYGSNPWLPLAQGELETALNEFIAQGRKSPIARYSDTYFELICNVDMAKLRLLQVNYILEHRGAIDAIRPFLASCRESALAAEKVSPDAAEVRELKQLLGQYEQLLPENHPGAPPGAPLAPPPPARPDAPPQMHLSA